jgi:hypothetical protein
MWKTSKHDRIISLRGKVLGPWSSLNPRLFLFVNSPVLNKEREQSCICVLTVSILPLLLRFFYWTLEVYWQCSILEVYWQWGILEVYWLWYFGGVLTVWYFVGVLTVVFWRCSDSVVFWRCTDSVVFCFHEFIALTLIHWFISVNTNTLIFRIKIIKASIPTLWVSKCVSSNSSLSRK